MKSHNQNILIIYLNEEKCDLIALQQALLCISDIEDLLTPRHLLIFHKHHTDLLVHHQNDSTDIRQIQNDLPKT